MKNGIWKFLGEDPGLPGLTFRSVNVEEEKCQIDEVIARSCRADGMDVGRQMRSCGWRPLTGAQAVDHRESVAAELNGRMVAYAELRPMAGEGQIGLIYQMDGYVLPEWRCCGIGSALSEHIEEACRRLEHKAEPRLDACARGVMTSRRQLLQDRGFIIWRYRFEFIHSNLSGVQVREMPAGWEVSEERGEQAKLLEIRQNGIPAATVHLFADGMEHCQPGKEIGYLEIEPLEGTHLDPEMMGAILSRGLAASHARGLQQLLVNVDVNLPENAFDFGMYVELGFQLDHRLLMYRKNL